MGKKPISKSKNPGLAKMAKSGKKGKATVEKFGYDSNRITAKNGGHQQLTGFGAVMPQVKKFGKS